MRIGNNEAVVVFVPVDDVVVNWVLDERSTTSRML